MTGWTRHEGPAAGLDMENIDTDQLIPARFMSAPRSAGYGRYLLHDLRFDEAGAARDFPLETGASVIVARRNFGCGSSREAAVYALVDFGVCAVIAPSFGDIFAGNAVNNGLLPAEADEALVESLLERLEHSPARLVVDLETCRIAMDDIEGGFEIDPGRREKLMNGWDDIDLTKRHLDEIAGFRAALERDAGWARPQRETTKR